MYFIRCSSFQWTTRGNSKIQLNVYINCKHCYVSDIPVPVLHRAIITWTRTNYYVTGSSKSSSANCTKSKKYLALACEGCAESTGTWLPRHLPGCSVWFAGRQLRLSSDERSDSKSCRRESDQWTCRLRSLFFGLHETRSHYIHCEQQSFNT